MASRKDYEAAVEILRHIQDRDTRLGQTRRWAIYFEQDNPRFDRDRFFSAVEKEDK